VDGARALYNHSAGVETKTRGSVNVCAVGISRLSGSMSAGAMLMMRRRVSHPVCSGWRTRASYASMYSYWSIDGSFESGFSGSRGPPQTQQLSLCCTLHAHDGARKNIDPKLSDCDACKISSIWWGRRRTLRHHESRWCLTGDPPIDVEVSWHIVMVSLKSALTGTRICRWHLADVLGGVLGQWRSFL